jgi:hypothetical protein
MRHSHLELGTSARLGIEQVDHHRRLCQSLIHRMPQALKRTGYRRNGNATPRHVRSEALLVGGRLGPAAACHRAARTGARERVHRQVTPALAPLLVCLVNRLYVIRSPAGVSPMLYSLACSSLSTYCRRGLRRQPGPRRRASSGDQHRGGQLAIFIFFVHADQPVRSNP